MLKMRVILALLAIMLVSLAGAQADSTDRAVLCGDLPETDCQILLDNESVMNSLNSFAFLMDMSFAVSGDEAMQLAGQAGGALSLGDEALRAANEMSENMSEADASALIELLLTSLEADLWFNVQGASGEEDFDMELSLQMKDGIVLIGAEALEALTGEPMTGMEAFGVDLNGAIGELLEESGAMPATDVSDMEAAGAAAMTVTRLPDSEVNGVAVAVFETDIDLDILFSLVSVEELVAASDDLDDPQMASELIEGIDVREFYVRQYIGLDNLYTYRTEMSLDMSMAFEDDSQATDAAVVMDMSVDLSEFGEPVVVEIPEDAFVFPLLMMMQMGDQ